MFGFGKRKSELQKMQERVAELKEEQAKTLAELERFSKEPSRHAVIVVRQNLGLRKKSLENAIDEYELAFRQPDPVAFYNYHFADEE